MGSESLRVFRRRFFEISKYLWKTFFRTLKPKSKREYRKLLIVENFIAVIEEVLRHMVTSSKKASANVHD